MGVGPAGGRAFRGWLSNRPASGRAYIQIKSPAFRLGNAGLKFSGSPGTYWTVTGMVISPVEP